MQLVVKGRNSSLIEITTSGEEKSVSHLAMAKCNKSPKEDFNQAARERVSLPSYSAEDMIKLQSADKALIFLRANLESGILLRESELITSSPEEKCNVLQRGCFMLDDYSVILWKPTEEKVAKRLLLPKYSTL